MKRFASWPVRFAVVLTATATLMGTAAAAPAAAALPYCGQTSVANGEGYGEARANYKSLKNGPYSACHTIIDNIPGGYKFWAWCWHMNYYGNWWIYGRLDGTNLMGFVYENDFRWVNHDDNGNGRFEKLICQ